MLRLSKGIERCFQLAEYAISLPATCLSSISEQHNQSANDILHHAKNKGSALLAFDVGEMLIEVNQEENGIWVFKATDSMLDRPKVIIQKREGDGYNNWEEKVTTYLKKYVGKITSTDYGRTERRWKQGTFRKLLHDFELTGKLFQQNGNVILKLPRDDQPLVFTGSNAELKAQIVLKYVYDKMKTPDEESGSHTRDLLTRAFLCYLQASGSLLAPWMEKNVRFVKSSDIEFTNRMEDNILSRRIMPVEGTSSLFERFYRIAFSSSFQDPYVDISKADDQHQSSISLGLSFQEKTVNGLSKVLIGLLATREPKIGFLGILSALPVTSYAAHSPLLTNSAKKSNAFVTEILHKRNEPISLNNPLPDLNASINQPFQEIIFLREVYQTANPNSNLEFSCKQTNGSALPNWLTLNIGPISLQRDHHLGTSVKVVRVSGNYAYVLTSTKQLLIFDITNPANPQLAGSRSFSYNDIYNLLFKNGYAYLATTSIKVYNVADPANILFVSDGPYESYVYGMATSGSHLYYIGYYNGYAEFCILDITNPQNLVLLGSTSSLGVFGIFTTIGISGNYAYVVCDDPRIFIIDFANPASPKLVRSLSVGNNMNLAAPLAKGNILFLAADQYVKTYNITQKTNPVLISTIELSMPPPGQLTTAKELSLAGNYLYASCGINGIWVIDVANPQSPKIVSSFGTPASANQAVVSGNNLFSANDNGITIYRADERVFYGTPTSADRGLLLLDMTASDEEGNSLSESVAVHVGNVNVMPISNQQVYVGNTTLFTVPATTFDYPGANFTYTANLAGGLPLPPFIDFNPTTQTFLIAPQSGDQNTYPLELTADDGNGGITKTRFNLNVADRPPVLEQPLRNQTAFTGESFEYIFSSDSFSDSDGDTLSYSAHMVGTNGLPGWLTFDPVLRKFSGLPFGKGVYPIEVIASDGYGGSLSHTFIITVPPSPPIVLNPLNTQTASVGNPYSYTFNTNTFFDVDNEPLAYRTDSLPAFLSFSSATRTFIGTPQTEDVGTYSITVHAEDPEGLTTSSTFSLNIINSVNNNPPVLVKAIPNQTEKAGVPFSFTFDPGTFVAPSNNEMTYQATLESGAPLPEGLFFESDTRTLSGVVQNPQALRITIRAIDPAGGFAVATFTLDVIGTYPPIVLNPLPNGVASVGEPFSYHIPSYTFADPNHDPLKITVFQSNGTPLPKWMKWDPVTSTLTGTPGPWDTNIFQIKDIMLEAWASDGLGSAKSSFTISVGGESFWATFIKYGVSFSTLIVGSIGAWESRALIWNYFNKKKYHKGVERAITGTEFNHKINLPLKNVKEVKAFYNGKPMVKLPNGLTYDDNQISGIPKGNNEGYYTIRVVDHQGYIYEEFDLIIKNNENDPDPCPDLSSLEKVKKRLKLKQKSDDEKSNMMKPLI